MVSVFAVVTPSLGVVSFESWSSIPNRRAAAHPLVHNTSRADPVVFWCVAVKSWRSSVGFMPPRREFDEADAEAPVENCPDAETRSRY